MNRAAAWSVRGVGRETREIAEEAARRAGMSLGDWLDEVVAEQAAEQGVSTDVLDEDDKLDAIGERLSKLSRGDRSKTASPRNINDAASAPPEAKPSAEEAQRARDLLDAAISKFDARAAKNEERTAKALESVASWIEHNQVDRAAERATLESVAQKLTAIEQRSIREAQKPPAEPPRAEAESDFDRRLGALARRVAAPPRPRNEPRRAAERPRIDVRDSVAQIARRQSELDSRDAVARASQPAASGWRNFGVDPALAEPRAAPLAVGRAIRPQPGAAANAASGVETLRKEIADLSAQVERLRADEAGPARPSGDAEDLRTSLAAMSRSLADLAPRNASVGLEGAVGELGERLDAARRAGASDRLVTPLEAMVEQVRETLREHDPRTAAEGLEREIRALGGKVEALARATVSPEVFERLRGQTEEVRNLLASTALRPIPIERLERQIGELSDRIERLATSPTPHADTARVIDMLSEARSQIERSSPAAALNSIEYRLEQLAARMDDALVRTPTIDPRPIEDLARRIDGVRAFVERQSDHRPEAARLQATLGEISSKLDRMPVAGVDPQTLTASLQEMTARLEDAFRRSASSANFDPRPIEDLARRIEAIKSAVERQGDFRPHAAKLEAALGDISTKLDRLPANGADSKALTSTLQGLTARLEEAFRRPPPAAQVDPRPLEELGRRIEGVRTSADFRPHAAKLEAALGEISSKLDRPAAASVDTRALTSTLQELTARLDEVFRRSISSANFDPRPIEDLVRRIEAMQAAIERQGDFRPHAAKLETALSEINSKLDRLPASSADTTASLSTLQNQMARLEEAFRRPAMPAQIDAKPLEDLARRIEGVRASADFRPHAAKLEAALGDISNKLDRPAGAADMKALTSTLQELTARLEDVFQRSISSANFDPRPIEDLVRRIESLRTTMLRQDDFRPQAAKLEAALGEINSKLDRQPGAGADSAAALTTLQSQMARLEEAFRRPPAPAPFDPKPLDDLARRIEGVRATMEKQGDFRPHAAKLEAALGDISSKLDHPPTDRVLTSTLQDLTARLDEAFRRPAPAIDPEPIEDLARRIEGVRSTMQRREDFRPHAERLEAALSDINSKLDRPAPAESTELTSTLQELTARLDEAFRRPASAIDPEPIEDLARRIDGVREAIDRTADFLPDAGKLDSALAEISGKLDLQAFSPDDLHALTSVMQDLAVRIDQAGSHVVDTAPIERMLRSFIERPLEIDTTPIEAMLRDLGEKFAASAAPAAIDTGLIERMLGRVDAKLDAVARVPMDVRPLEQAVRDLHDKLDFRDAPQIDSKIIEQAAELLAKRLEIRDGSGIDAEALVNQISEIHGRLDQLNTASQSNATLERTVADLLDELEAMRQTLQSSASAPREGAPAVDEIAEWRAEQIHSDRRMQTRLADVQDILEKLVSRLGRIEDEFAGADEDEPEPGRPPQSFAPRSTMIDPPRGADFSDAALRSIPDRIPPSAERSEMTRAEVAGAPKPNGAKPFLPQAGDDAPRPRKLDFESLPPAPARNPEAPARNSDINAHIAAARRAAQAALLESASKNDEPEARQKAKAGSGLSAVRQAREFVVVRRRPILLGIAFLAAVTTLAVELRGGRHPSAPQKSELPTPVESAPPVASAPGDRSAPRTAGAVDYSPVGTVAAARPASKTAPSRPAPADMTAAIPISVSATLRDAATSGDPGAETEVALRCLEGRGMIRDPKTAARWFEQAAVQGLPIAQYRLAALYEKGTGVTRDVPLARSWYTKAANAGNARAMHNLGVLDAEDGGAGKPDYAEAAQWFRRAGELGVRDSQFNLAVLLGRGLGVPQDLGQSWVWFSLAARQGDTDAAKKRDEVAAKLDAAGLAAATKALADFKVRAPDPSANEAPAPAGGWDGKDAPQSTRPSTPTPVGAASGKGAHV